MGLNNSPPQVCMEAPDWRQICHGIDDDEPITGSSSPSEEINIGCSRPMIIERRARPQHEQALKCPRCDSTHTKFCYYNNYSLSQPRYFCKSCRRYWTKGGSLRNVPVGGGCRKNKKTTAKKQSVVDHPSPDQHLYISHDMAPDQRLPFPGLQMAQHLNTLLSMSGNYTNLMECKYDIASTTLGNNPAGHVDDFMKDASANAMLGNSRTYGFMGSSDLGHLGTGGVGDMMSHGFASSSYNNIHGSCSSSYGFSMDHGCHDQKAPYMGIGEKMLLPFAGGEDPNAIEHHDIKPSSKFLSLEWQEQGCSEAHERDPLGHLMNGLGSWSAAMNGYVQPSTTNPLL